MAKNKNYEQFLDNSARFYDEGVATKTSQEQENIEESLFRHSLDKLEITLRRGPIISSLKKYLKHLPRTYQNLDASQAWICYWIVQSLSLLNVHFDTELINSVVDFLKRCQSPTGGYGGGPQQDPHLAPTYAAVNALCILGTEEAFDSIDRKNLYKFLLQMKQPDGSFIMHKDGEADIRGLYCALSVASLTNILTPKLYDNTEDWIMQCQTYEGGFGGSPECEAHGGYTFCAFAALNIIEKTQKINIKSLMRWLTSRQMSYEGGFNGRTNKLVDSCYSFWQGGSFPLLSRLLLQRGYQVPQLWLMDSEALQKYVIFFCQSEYGGLCDKLQNSWDLYHTCYALSGLAVAQHCMSKKVPFLGNEHNLLNPTHPIYNIGMKEAFEAVAYFKSLPLIEEEEM